MKAICCVEDSYLTGSRLKRKIYIPYFLFLINFSGYDRMEGVCKLNTICISRKVDLKKGSTFGCIRYFRERQAKYVFVKRNFSHCMKYVFACIIKGKGGVFNALDWLRPVCCIYCMNKARH